MRPSEVLVVPLLARCRKYGSPLGTVRIADVKSAVFIIPSRSNGRVDMLEAVKFFNVSHSNAHSSTSLLYCFLTIGGSTIATSP